MTLPLAIAEELANTRETGAALPLELTSFIGRRQERADLRRALSGSRLVTLTGFGGVGKTRLALRVGADTRRAFSGGVWFVELAELRVPELLADTVAVQLGLRGLPAQASHRALGEFIGSREALLILDNCEHVIDASASLTDYLLHACPRLRILATSREPLRIAGEAVFPVTPLSVPGDGERADGPAHHCESVDLFLERAQAVMPGFALSHDDRSAVTGICRYLEGIPLALELAAVRLRALSPADLLARLTGHQRLLTVGARNAPDRQRTLDACIEWSYDLCSDEERELWARASVFHGGFKIEAAERLYSEAEGPDHVLDLVHALTEKSILITEEHHGRIRHRMLESIREFGLLRLTESGHVEQIRRRHCAWCSDLASRFASDWLGPRQAEWVDRLQLERANLQAAIDYCISEPGEAEVGLAIATNLQDYVVARGLFTHGRHWFDQLLALPIPTSSTLVSGVRAASGLAVMQGDLDAAGRLIALGRQLCAGLDAKASADIDQAAGIHAMFAADIPSATRHLERALKTYRASGQRHREIETISLLAITEGIAGNTDRSLDYHQQCVALTEPIGEKWLRSLSLWITGLTTLALGDVRAATDLELQSLGLSSSMDDRLGMALCLDALAWIAAASDPLRAARLLGAADGLWQTMGTSTLVNPGLATRREACEQYLRQALQHEDFTAEYEQGRALSLSDSVEFALSAKPTPRSPRPARHQDPERADIAGTLTRREREVAELVARGLTNREIASQLVITVRTAEGHIANILTKHGFTSRAQIATWVTEQRVD
jgi:predicted ATPase/DNA-binding CsgD family transcriptional regulator